MGARLSTWLWFPARLVCKFLDLLVTVVWHAVPRTRKFLMEFGSDRATVIFQHLLNFGLPPRLKSPRTYAEKMSFLKLHHDNPLLGLCSDKIAVGSYLRSLGLEHLLVPVLGIYDRPEDIPWPTLPSRFVAKTNHGSNFYIICRDRKTLDTVAAVKDFNIWLGYDFSRWMAETNYRGIRPRILVEELVALPEDLVEYKFFCFHGVPRFVSVITGRRGGTPIRRVYDMQWQALELGSRGLIRDTEPGVRPEFFPDLVRYATRLSEDFIQVRVDFLVAGDRIHFSELTFYNLGGFAVLEPEAMNDVVGSWIDLDREKRYAERGRKIRDHLVTEELCL